MANFWSGLLGERHRELLREASRERLAKESRRVRREGRPARPGTGAPPSGERWVVRPGTSLDAPGIANLLELNGMPRWVAFEERFIVLEEGSTLMAALRFRAGTARLHLGLLVTGPWAEEHSLAVALYSRAWTLARNLGLEEIEARTSRHGWQLLEAGYHRRGGVWLASA